MMMVKYQKKVNRKYFLKVNAEDIHKPSYTPISTIFYTFLHKNMLIFFSYIHVTFMYIHIYRERKMEEWYIMPFLCSFTECGIYQVPFSLNKRVIYFQQLFYKKKIEKKVLRWIGNYDSFNIDLEFYKKKTTYIEIQYVSI